jgi:plastocyanin
MKTLFTGAALLALAYTPTAAFADAPEYSITIKDHTFTPDTVEVPADTKVKLIVKNEDKTAEEFESHELNREKVIQGGSQASIFIGPLKSGEYKFFGEFHEKTAQGKIVVK